MASEDQGYLDSDTHTRDKPLQVCDNLQVTPHLTEEAQRRQRKRSRHFCCWRFGRMVGIWGENTGEPKFQCGKKEKTWQHIPADACFSIRDRKLRSTSKWSSTFYPVLSFLSFLDFTIRHHRPKHLSNPSLTLSHHSLLPRRTQSPSHRPNYRLPFSPH